MRFDTTIVDNNPNSGVTKTTAINALRINSYSNNFITRRKLYRNHCFFQDKALNKPNIKESAMADFFVRFKPVFYPKFKESRHDTI